MPPQQGDNEEDAEASTVPAQAPAGGGGKGHSGGDDVTIRVVHAHKRKGSGDGDGMGEEKPVELLNCTAAVEAAEAEAAEEELRATRDMVHYCFGAVLAYGVVCVVGTWWCDVAGTFVCVSPANAGNAYPCIHKSVPHRGPPPPLPGRGETRAGL